MEALSVVALEKRFGGLLALDGVSLAVRQGERRALIGPNGAGKTTLFNVISGEARPSAGRVFVEGKEITGLPPHAVAGRGIARTFQRNNVLFGLTVFENVRLAAQRQAGVSGRLLTPVHQLAAVDAAAMEALDRVNLGERGDLLARDLSYGEQRQLELAMALALRPRLLLLDEPCAGMAPAETALLRDIIARIPRAITVVIIEHDMDVVFALADRITVMHQGQVLAEGTPEEVRGDCRVREVYLGEGEGLRLGC